MKLSHQQKQTKRYFEKVATQWKTKANLNSSKILNVINQRNSYVKGIASRFLSKNAKILDVGCGTGELVIELLKQGFDAQGIDFSKSMIKKAKEQAVKHNVSKEAFIEHSFFDYNFNKKYDLISANGFIEYISENELKDFLLKSHQLLTKNGIIIISSRNRLFNVFSFNEYTVDEMKMQNLNSLIEECLYFNSGKNLKNILKIKKRSKLRNNIQKHSKTGINVETRFQYTPFQLREKLENIHFKIFDISPIHIHIFTTETRKIYPELHNQVSNYIQNQKQIIGLIPQSSSFMIAAKKK